MHGLLFTSDFLREGIRHTRGWMDAETGFLAFRDALARLRPDLENAESLNEAQTEDEVIVPVLRTLGWTDLIRQATTSQADALYFNLYGMDRAEAAYVLDTFPIVRAQEERAFGRYRTRDLVLGYMNALDAGDTESVLAL
ncbi:hypothetical protein [Lysobacter sp. A3-1-A15]|uniref:hypothetical protein n=1 Tax=Novilysobacter viscosus TaxID=3098602 RepID=UPI002ED83D83